MVSLTLALLVFVGGGLPQPVGDGGVVGQVDHDPVLDVRFRSASELFGFHLGCGRWRPADLRAARGFVGERGEYGPFEGDDVSGVPDGLSGSVRCPAVVSDDRATGDPYLWASTLFDEVVELGYLGGYSTFTRALRRYKARPHCEPCKASSGRDVAIIAHPPGDEIQSDWVELPDPPAEWGVGANAHLLVGALAHSGRWRAVLAEADAGVLTPVPK